jgi:hypothetical protein
MKAYPYMHKHPTSGQTTISEGMDLRDWFAGMALQGLLTLFKKQRSNYSEARNGLSNGLRIGRRNDETT